MFCIFHHKDGWQYESLRYTAKKCKADWCGGSMSEWKKWHKNGWRAFKVNVIFKSIIFLLLCSGLAGCSNPNPPITLSAIKPTHVNRYNPANIKLHLGMNAAECCNYILPNSIRLLWNVTTNKYTVQIDVYGTGGWQMYISGNYECLGVGDASWFDDSCEAKRRMINILISEHPDLIYDIKPIN